MIAKSVIQTIGTKSSLLLGLLSILIIQYTHNFETS